MKDEKIENVIRNYYEREREARNAVLTARLEKAKSFEEMLGELSSIRGLNVEERELALA